MRRFCNVYTALQTVSRQYVQFQHSCHNADYFEAFQQWILPLKIVKEICRATLLKACFVMGNRVK